MWAAKAAPELWLSGAEVCTSSIGLCRYALKTGNVSPRSLDQVIASGKRLCLRGLGEHAYAGSAGGMANRGADLGRAIPLAPPRKPAEARLSLTAPHPASCSPKAAYGQIFPSLLPVLCSEPGQPVLRPVA
jgi:hypothetical protein